MTEKYFVQSESNDEIEYTVSFADFLPDCTCPSRSTCKHIDVVYRQKEILNLQLGETAYHEVYVFYPQKGGRFMSDDDSEGVYWKTVGRTVYYYYLLPVRGFVRQGTTYKPGDRGHLSDLRKLMTDHGIPRSIAFKHTRFL